MHDDTNFTARKVLVVGGSSGIGNGIAQAFRMRGADVTVWGTRSSAADYAGEHGSNLAGLTYECVDVADAGAIAAAAARHAALDVLVLCQGTVVYKCGEFEKDGWDQVMAVNLDSLMHCAREFKRPLAESRGSLIIISSTSGYQANIGNPAYAASKAGAISLTKTLAKAWAAEGIRVNGVAPGFVETKLTAVASQNPKRMAAALAQIPLGRPATPDEMAGGVIFLASPLASYLCGTTLLIDGGLLL